MPVSRPFSGSDLKGYPPFRILETPLASCRRAAAMLFRRHGEKGTLSRRERRRHGFRSCVRKRERPQGRLAGKSKNHHCTSRRAPRGSRFQGLERLLGLPHRRAAPSLSRAIERIEEDFTLTRMVARTTATTAEDVEKALLPFRGIRAQPLLGATKIEDRLRARSKDVPADAVTAFLSETPAVNVARTPGAKS